MKVARDEKTMKPGRRVVLAVAGAVVVSSALVAGLLVGNSATRSGTSGGTWPRVALASSFVTPAGSWAILPMGRLSDPLNTFWQLFFRAAGRSEWTLVTPPGVADNGGLAAAPGAEGSVAIVFEPTNLLTFSPLAITSDNGKTWSGGVIPFGTASAPDVLTAPSPVGGCNSPHLPVAARGSPWAAGSRRTGRPATRSRTLRSLRRAVRAASLGCRL